MAEFASKGVAGAGLGTGIGGLALGLLNGGLGNLFGVGNCAAAAACSENQFVNRYELDMENKLVSKDSEIALLKSNIYTDQKIVDVYKELSEQINAFKAEQAAINTQQAVYNATANANIACIQAQVAQLQALTKTVVPIDNVCPTPMPRYNSFTTPTSTTPAA